jgi:hypothetical protein
MTVATCYSLLHTVRRHDEYLVLYQHDSSNAKYSVCIVTLTTPEIEIEVNNACHRG